MNTLTQVDELIAQMKAEGQSAPEIVRQTALACLEWPYVFGAWGEECTPANRRRRARAEYPTIVSKCQVLSGRAAGCHGCKWGEGVRMYDCRGFTAWLLRQVGIDLYGDGATTQYNTARNWAKRGLIREMPDCVCCVFRAKGKRKEHTGMHLGGGVVIDCSTGVSSVGMRGWTHYGVPVGLYSEGEIPVETVKPVLRKGDRGDNVRELQERLNELGYDCGTADGVFGTRTFNALVCFQTDAGIDPDGACGPVTRRALAAALPAPAPLWRVVIGGLTAARRDEVLQMFPHAACGREG